MLITGYSIRFCILMNHIMPATPTTTAAMAAGWGRRVKPYINTDINRIYTNDPFQSKRSLLAAAQSFLSVLMDIIITKTVKGIGM